MHRLQKHILHQLIFNPTARYADLKPKEVEGNLFMYHLRQLMLDGLVAKRADGLYELSPAGKLFADKLSLELFAPRIQPKIVTIIACKNDVGEWLLLKRKRQPLINLTGFPYGKIHLGETIQQAAERELREKTGLTADLAHQADGYIEIYQDEELVSHVFFHFFVGTNPMGKLRGKTKSGQVFWRRVDDWHDPKYMPSMNRLAYLAESGDLERAFEEMIFHL